MEYFKGFKDKKAFDAKVDDLEYRLNKEGIPGLIHTDKHKLKVYHEAIAAHDAVYWFFLFLDAFYDSVPDEVTKYITEYKAMLKGELYARKTSTIEAARFYALAVHLRKLPSLKNSRRKEATLKCLADSLSISGSRLRQDFVKSEDLITAGKFRVFKNAQYLMGFLP